MKLYGYGVFVVLACVLGMQAQESPAAAARRADTYAVYSALMMNPGIRITGDGPLLIAAATLTSLPNIPLSSCAPPLPEYETSWREVMTEVEAGRRASSVERLFTMAAPYRLLEEPEIRAIQEQPRSSANPPQTFRLGNVYFNKERTIALTYIAMSCGTLCGRGGWRLFEKDGNGRWRPAPPWLAAKENTPPAPQPAPQNGQRSSTSRPPPPPPPPVICGDSIA